MSADAKPQLTPDFFSAAVEGSIDPIIAIDRMGTVLYFNPAAARAFQYDAHEVVGKNVKMLMPEPYQSEHDGYLSNYQNTGVRKIIGIGREVVALRKDGTTYPIHLSISEFTLGSDTVFLGVARDISDLRQLQDELAESQEQSKNLIGTAVDGIITIDGRGTIQSVNPAACRLFEYTADELVARNVKMLMPEPYQSEHDGYLRHHHETGEKKIIGIGREVVCVTKSRKQFPAHLSISEYTAGGKKFFAGIIHDISTLKKFESELQRVTKLQQKQLWMVERQLKLADALNANLDKQEFYQRVLDRCVETLGAEAGCYYETVEMSDGPQLEFQCGHTSPPPDASHAIPFGQGTVGQTAVDRKLRLVENVDEFFIATSFGKLKPKSLLVLPVTRSEKTVGVLEMAFTGDADFDSVTALWENFQASFAIAVEGLIAKQRVAELYEQAQAQAKELESSNFDLQQKGQELVAQQDEMAVVNEELLQKTQELQAQQEELQSSNEELEEQRNAIANQKKHLEMANERLEQSQRELKHQQEELKSASRYKSEFLANMSHELRTPLNSLLILAKLLSENEDNNLTEDQINYATIIYNAGSELLNLINDVLDLSKVEVGKLEIKRENVSLATVLTGMRQLFNHSMQEKGLDFRQTVAPDLPKSIYTDRIRLEQILRNLIGNAQKFTESGYVALDISKNSAEQIVFSVEDTGIGIPEDELQAIFEAFQQIDGTLNRKFTGTGLGLSISKNLAELLGGQIKVESRLGVGSRFSFIIANQVQTPQPQGKHGKVPVVVEVSDDRSRITSGDKIVQIVEDDTDFAKSLIEYAHRRNFKCIVSTDGESGLRDARSFSPDVILLDINLPKLDGLRVLEKLRASPDTIDTPIYIMSGTGQELKSASLGANDYFLKPVQFEQLDAAFSEGDLPEENAKVLLVEDDPDASYSIQQMIQRRGFDVKIAGTVEAARRLVAAENYDCVVLDLSLGQESGLTFLGWLKSNVEYADLPVVVHTGVDIDSEDESQLLEQTKSIVIKSAQSPERLMEEISRLITRDVEEKILQLTNGAENVLADKTVLVVDDDMRNAYSLKEVLKRKKMNVLIAKNGIEAVQKTKETKPLDIVLMDIMMPEMDGLDAMRAIRADEKFADLPIIALTAKAMPEDRESCVDAGADDYLPKPVDLDKLANLITMLLRD